MNYLENYRKDILKIMDEQSMLGKPVNDLYMSLLAKEAFIRVLDNSRGFEQALLDAENILDAAEE